MKSVSYVCDRCDKFIEEPALAIGPSEIDGELDVCKDCWPDVRSFIKGEWE